MRLDRAKTATVDCAVFRIRYGNGKRTKKIKQKKRVTVFLRTEAYFKSSLQELLQREKKRTIG